MENIDIPYTAIGEPEIPQPPNLAETSAETLQELFPNYAENESIAEKTKERIRSLFSNISDREELESIWQKNDQMYRVKPDSSVKEENRANEATGVFHISVNQLVSMAFKTMTDNVENYSYGYTSIMDNEGQNTVRARNAEIMTLLVRKSMRESNFKGNLKQSLYDIYKNGTAFVGIPWDKQVIDMDYRDKESGERKSKLVTRNNLPRFEFIPLDSLYLDENIDTIDAQPLIAVRTPITWTKLISDIKKNKIKIFEKDGDQSLHDKFEKYKETQNATQFTSAKSDRFDNANRTLTDRTKGQYKHWVHWVNLPINKQTGEWDDNGAETRCRVRMLGDPESGDIIEIRANIFPSGIPILAAHQTQDDIGMYPISLGEKIETYYDQICVSVNQMIDNRSKNLRRSIVCDPLRVKMDNYNFGHSNVIPVDGDVQSALMELKITDMTGTIMNSISYCEQKVREIMNTTDAVVGAAMGGRTSASEYMGAKVAATTPIFSDMASIEDALIGEYMRRFSQYVHLFMRVEDITDQIGQVGSEFQFELNDIYNVELRGVMEVMSKTEKIQGLIQLFGMIQDQTARSRLILRIARTMGIENPAELVVIPAKDQAIKAALWENNELLVYGRWDEPEMGELHDVHLSIHRQAEWQAQREQNPNVNFIRQHIMQTESLKRSETAMGGINSFPAINGQPASSMPPTPGEESGQAISAEMGNIQAGSQVPV